MCNLQTKQNLRTLTGCDVTTPSVRRQQRHGSLSRWHLARTSVDFDSGHPSVVGAAAASSVFIRQIRGEGLVIQVQIKANNVSLVRQPSVAAVYHAVTEPPDCFQRLWVQRESTKIRAKRDAFQPSGVHKVSLGWVRPYTSCCDHNEITATQGHW